MSATSKCDLTCPRSLCFHDPYDSCHSKSARLPVHRNPIQGFCWLGRPLDEMRIEGRALCACPDVHRAARSELLPPTVRHLPSILRQHEPRPQRSGCTRSLHSDTPLPLSSNSRRSTPRPKLPAYLSSMVPSASRRWRYKPSEEGRLSSSTACTICRAGRKPERVHCVSPPHREGAWRVQAARK